MTSAATPAATVSPARDRRAPAQSLAEAVADAVAEAFGAPAIDLLTSRRPRGSLARLVMQNVLSATLPTSKAHAATLLGFSRQRPSALAAPRRAMAVREPTLGDVWALVELITGVSRAAAMGRSRARRVVVARRLGRVIARAMLMAGPAELIAAGLSPRCPRLREVERVKAFLMPRRASRRSRPPRPPCPPCPRKDPP